MRLTSITIANNHKGFAAYALITLASAGEAQSFLGSGEDEIEHHGAMLRVRPIAIGHARNSVCCRIVDQS